MSSKQCRCGPDGCADGQCPGRAEPIYEWVLSVDGDMQGGGWAGSLDELRAKALLDIEDTKRYPMARGKAVTAALYVKYELEELGA